MMYVDHVYRLKYASVDTFKLAPATTSKCLHVISTVIVIIQYIIYNNLKGVILYNDFFIFDTFKYILLTIRKYFT